MAFDIWFWMPVMLGGAIAGASTSAIGVYIIGMRLPFLGICVAHAALAGAVIGSLLGLHGQMLLLPALIFAVATALLLGLVGKSESPAGVRAVDDNVLLSVLFSLSMGVVFLGMGLFPRFGISDADVRGLLWGNLNFCQWNDVGIMAATAILVMLFVVVLAKELRAILFSRTQAAAAGVPATAIWTTFLLLAAIVLTVDFQTVGGLMIYGLMTSPAVAAFQLTHGFRRSLLLATSIGGASGISGFLLAAATDLPTGATTVILCSLAALFAIFIKRYWRASSSVVASSPVASTTDEFQTVSAKRVDG